MIRAKVAGVWTQLTFVQWKLEAQALARGLVARGVAQGDRVLLVANTRRDWLIADMAIVLAGAVTVPVYHSALAEEAVFIAQNSGAVAAVVEHPGQLAKFWQARADLPTVQTYVWMDDRKEPEAPFGSTAPAVGDPVLLAQIVGQPGPSDPAVLSVQALQKLGRSVPDATLDERLAQTNPHDLATLVYTSGTTGRPKGVMLSHRTFLAEVDACRAALDVRSDDRLLLFLPLAHIFAKMVYVVCVALRAEMAIPQSMVTLVDDLREAAPTCMPAVPRVFEKLHNRIRLELAHKSPVAQKVFHWALGVGQQVASLRQKGQQPGTALALQHKLAHKLVFSKIHAKFGGRIRGFISGGAPLSKELAEFFAAMDLLILEGYGMTENCAAATVNRLESYKLGTVGRPLQGVEVQIASDGEVLLRGPIVMQGYWNNPEATAEALQDGWLHTGDIGELDPDGFLRITDRKKDLIVTAGGKNVAPQNVEAKLKGSPYISQAMVYGDRRKFLSALVTLEEGAVTAWAKQKGIGPLPFADLTKNAEVYKLLEGEIAAVNRGLASYETIKKFAILDSDFTVEGGELTASLKIRRKEVVRKYQSLLDSFYTEHY